MPTKAMQELVGRVMIDPAFLDELVHAPEATLDRFHLDDDERAAVLRAVQGLATTPPPRRTAAFRAAMVRRVST
jgi:hypothetical protein